MKNTGFFLMLILLLSSCGGSKSSGNAAADSVSADTVMAEVPVADSLENMFYLTKDGIGAIHIGDEIKDMPEEIPGLYTEIVHGETDQAQEYVFRSADEVSFTALDYLEGKIDLIFLDSPLVKVKSPSGSFGMGDSFDNVLALPGVTPEWYSRDDNGHGIWYWTWEGLWFTVNQERLTPSLQDKLYTSEEAPVSEDFDSDIRIGYIGTGAPF